MGILAAGGGEASAGAAAADVCPDRLFAPGPRGGVELAAAAEPAAPHRGVEFFALPTRGILTRCRSSRVPFQWTINPYRGCEFGCQYCYARYAHGFLELRRPEDFERKIFAKQRAAEHLRRELRRVPPGDGIALGTATDPYQPAERQFGITRSLLEVFAQARGLKLGLVTKSALVVRDVDLLTQVAAANELTIRMTVTTADPALARQLEPRAPRPDLRLAALGRLRAAGLMAGVMCAPVLPGITDGEANLAALMAAAKAAGAAFFSAGGLFLQPAAAAQFLPFLDRQFPHLAAAYRRQFAASAYLPADYRRRLAVRVARLAARYGLPAAAPRATPAAPADGEEQATQLSFW
ncbi:MAG: radical SAM protein [Terriglobales bacterium]